MLIELPLSSSKTWWSGYELWQTQPCYLPLLHGQRRSSQLLSVSCFQLFSLSSLSASRSFRFGDTYQSKSLICYQERQVCAINSGCVCELLTADALCVSTYTSRMSCVTPRVAGHGLRQVMTGHAVNMLSHTAEIDMGGVFV